MLRIQIQIQPKLLMVSYSIKKYKKILYAQVLYRVRRLCLGGKTQEVTGMLIFATILLPESAVIFRMRIQNIALYNTREIPCYSSHESPR